MIPSDAFAMLGLAPQFSLDLNALEQAYFTLQRQHHPDKLGEAGYSMQLNQAYTTLKSPLSRARHLLALQGLDVTSGKGEQPGAALLMESMEQREALAEANTWRAVEALEVEYRSLREACIAELTRYFNVGDAKLAAQATLRLGYLEKILEECRQRRNRL